MLTYKKKIILALLDKLGERSITAKSFQKLLFLFTRKSGNKVYEFVPYRYGGFSFEANKDVYALAKSGYLEIQESEYHESIYKLLHHNSDVIQSLNLFDNMELDKIVKDFGNLNTDDLIAYTYRKYPYTAINSVIKQNLLNEVELERVEKERVRYCNNNAVLYIMMLAKGGLIPVVNGLELIRKEYWLDFVKATYYNYPTYCLFCTALYDDKKMVERIIAQLYTFSPIPQVLKLLPKLLLQILGCTRSEKINAQFRNNLFIYAEYFIKFLSYTEWFEEYKILFNENAWIEDKPNQHFYKEDRTFTHEALEYIYDERFCNDIISRCLLLDNNITDYQNQLVISARNGIKQLDKQNLTILNKWMAGDITVIQSFVVFNLHNLLDQDKFQKCLSTITDKLLKNDVVLEAVCAHIKSPNLETTKRLSLFVCISSGLWSTGIKSKDKDKISFGGSRRLNVDEIDRHFHINDDAVFSIYERMKSSFDDIKALCIKGTFEMTFNNWDCLVRSMLNFLIRHKELLSKQEDYARNFDDCKKLFFNIRDNKSIAERLSSSDDDEVQKAVIDLFQLVAVKGIGDFAFEYHILSSTIMQKRTKALQTCINHFSWIISEHETFFVKSGFKRDIELILKTYEPNFFDDGKPWTLEADKDHVEKDMLRIRKWADKQGVDIGLWKIFLPVYALAKNS